MKTYVNISVRAFPVRIRDQRTGEVRPDVIILDKARLQAAQAVGIDSRELIYRTYNRQGFYVLDIEKPFKAEITVDLEEMYRGPLARCNDGTEEAGSLGAVPGDH